MPLALIAEFADEYGVEVRRGWGMTETDAIFLESPPVGRIGKVQKADLRKQYGGVFI